MNDFKAQLRRQIGFLNNSCQTYDKGDVEEAVRIAVALRVLFHNTGKSISLLTHLGAKSAKLLSTAAPFVEHPLIPNLYLVQAIANIALAADRAQDTKRCVCEPLLEKALRNDFIDFSAWWQTEPVIKHKQPPTIMTRRDLVLSAANQDGGAHVDKNLHPVYDLARRGSGMEITLEFQPQWGRDPVTLRYENIHFGSLRQIGYEVLNSPDILALG